MKSGDPAVQDILSATRPTGAMIASLEKITDLPVRKALIDLLGADTIRMSSILAIGAIAENYKSLDLAGSPLTLKFLTDGLNGLKRIDIYRIFSAFPRDLTPKSFEPNCTAERQELEEVTYLYTTTGLWLIDNLRGGKHSNILLALGLDHAKKRAFVAERRYDVCDWVHKTTGNQFIKSFSVPTLWLLWEISICRKRLNSQHTYKGKRAKYDSWVNVWKSFDDFGADLRDFLRPAESATDLIESFEGFMLAEARSVAASNPDIDQLVYKTYIKAERTWGKSALGSGSKVIPYL